MTQDPMGMTISVFRSLDHILTVRPTGRILYDQKKDSCHKSDIAKAMFLIY